MDISVLKYRTSNNQIIQTTEVRKELAIFLHLSSAKSSHVGFSSLVVTPKVRIKVTHNDEHVMF